MTIFFPLCLLFLINMTFPFPRHRNNWCFVLFLFHIGNALIIKTFSVKVHRKKSPKKHLVFISNAIAFLSDPSTFQIPNHPTHPTHLLGEYTNSTNMCCNNVISLDNHRSPWRTLLISLIHPEVFSPHQLAKSTQYAVISQIFSLTQRYLEEGQWIPLLQNRMQTSYSPESTGICYTMYISIYIFRSIKARVMSIVYLKFKWRREKIALILHIPWLIQRRRCFFVSNSQFRKYVDVVKAWFLSESCRHDFQISEAYDYQLSFSRQGFSISF